jgi:hypothetical protein
MSKILCNKCLLKRLRKEMKAKGMKLTAFKVHSNLKQVYIYPKDTKISSSEDHYQYLFRYLKVPLWCKCKKGEN